MIALLKKGKQNTLIDKNIEESKRLPTDKMIIIDSLPALNVLNQLYERRKRYSKEHNIPIITASQNVQVWNNVNEQIKKINNEQINDKVMKVKDEFRTHPWSFEPGGTTVIVEYYNGKKVEYDKVKNVAAYTKKIKLNPDVKSVMVSNGKTIKYV